MANKIKFASDFGVDTKIYEQFQDYFNHAMAQNYNKNIGTYDETVSLADKESQMHDTLLSEVGKLANVSLSKDNAMVMARNPQVRWATMAIVNSLIPANIPNVLNSNAGKFMELKSLRFGDTAKYEVEPSSLFVVSEGTNAGQRATFLQKQFRGEKILEPRRHEVTVTVSLYRVLCGLESLADFVRKAILSIESEMYKEAWVAMEGALDSAVMPAPFVVTGYTPEDLLALLERVQAYNHGQAPMIFGSAVALSKILPD